jgi:adenylate kinase family enzyme
MAPRLHVLGASGSGTTTLGAALAAALRCPHIDADDYYWRQTDPPFTVKNDPPQRVAALQRALAEQDRWVLSGSVCGWGDVLRPAFTLAVFLWIPPARRLQRLIMRERQRFGSRIDAGGDMFEQHRAFLDWASRYDSAGPEMRSRSLHETWLATLPCPVLRLEAEASVERLVATVLADVSATRPGR